jgi:hypothetical protein
MTGFHSKQDMAAGKLQEPVAWQCADCGGTQSLCPHEHKDIPLYTAPPQRPWVGLTDDALADIWYKGSLDWMEFARAHEAALKEKNFD